MGLSCLSFRAAVWRWLIAGMILLALLGAGAFLAWRHLHVPRETLIGGKTPDAWLDWTAFRRPRRKAALVVVAMGALLSTAACGGNSSGGSGGGGIPSTIKVVGTEPLTGPAAFAGLALGPPLR